MDGFGDKVAFIWSVADLLRGDFKAHEYGQVILPFTVLRRLDCVLEPTRDAVVKKYKSLEGRVGNVEPVLLRAAGQPFYNTSPYTFQRLLDDPPNLARHLKQYVAGFSPAAAEVIDKYNFPNYVTRLENAGVLYHVVARFAEIDLHPEAVPNHAMGLIFEELLRKFSEMSNETAGDHFTPREVIRLMVNILFSEDDDALRGKAPVRTLYDPACGTGGMLIGGQEHLLSLNPGARLEVFGQELNPETWAIARSDLMIKGQDPTRIVLGNSFTNDGFTGQTFDYMLANPPFGVDWKKIEREVRDEAEHLGLRGRFGAGLPRINDGALLFLQHMISKMRPPSEGGSRLAIVLSGSPLFSGGAGSGESEIRRWIIENDLLEAIVGLPDQLFYNTGIATYFWVLTNRKHPDRRGKVALVDAREYWEKMPRSLGSKRKRISDEQIAEVTRLYHDAPHVQSGDRVKVFNNADFGYQRITVERPLRRRWEVTNAAIENVSASRAFARADVDQRARLEAMLDGLRGITASSEADFAKHVMNAASDCGIELSGQMKKAVLEAAALADPDAAIVVDRKGQPQPDPDLRDNENVPLLADVDDYAQREVIPIVRDAWVDHSKTRIGYEIPFTRHFYRHVPPRSVADIDADLAKVEGQIALLLEAVRR